MAPFPRAVQVLVWFWDLDLLPLAALVAEIIALLGSGWLDLGHVAGDLPCAADRAAVGVVKRALTDVLAIGGVGVDCFCHVVPPQYLICAISEIAGGWTVADAPYIGLDLLASIPNCA